MGASAEHIPPDIFCAQDYERAAQSVLPAPTFAYIAGGASAGMTAQANREIFSSWCICPRLLCDVSAGSTALTLAGQVFPHPVMLAPVAFQSLAHPRGELETARGAAAMHSCLISSTLSSHTLEDIAQHAGPLRWFQLYFQPDREHTLDLLRRAEAAGYRAIVVTLDAAIQLPGHEALRAGFRLPDDCIPAANLRCCPAVSPVAAGPGRIFREAALHGQGVSDIVWLLSQTTLPVWVKGVLHPEDARQLQTLGVAGIVVSNHGGRTLDGAPASLAMLPAVRCAVGDDYPLLFDGGIRSGADIFKAIALGADATLIGRLQVYALAVAGALGVAHLIRSLCEELEVTMAMAACASLADIRASRLLRAGSHTGDTLC